MKESLEFLSQLSRNNNRDWFNDNKSKYQETYKQFSDLVEKVILGIQKFDPAVLELVAKESLFRIYKDIRFSKDKTPYKTHFGAYMAKGGRKSQDAGYYLHIEPGNSFIAAGSYMPEKERLKAIRSEIMFRIEDYLELFDKNISAGYAHHDQEDKLKKAPKGFPPDFPQIEHLKYKHFIFARNYSDDQVCSSVFCDQVISGFGGLQPYVYFLNQAMDYRGNE